MSTTGNVYGTQDGVVYLKKYGTFAPFIWGGRCMRLEDTTDNLGGVTVTTRFNPRGGVERGGLRLDVPGDVSGTLAMKRIQADTMKTELKKCFWIVDQREHCSGLDRDAWTKWEEITRSCPAKMTDRVISGTNWEGDEDSMVTFSMSALEQYDIYRVAAEESTAGV